MFFVYTAMLENRRARDFPDVSCARMVSSISSLQRTAPTILKIVYNT